MGEVNQAAGAAGLSRPGTSPLILLTSLFFMWGFMTSLNDILIPHLRNAFALSYTQAMLIQFCFFGAYFLVSLPAGKLIDRVGYQKGIVIGLMIAGVGCLVFFPAAGLLSYTAFLGALFVLAAGITILQVSANPYVSALGDPASASSRLTLTQAFNSLGTTVAPFLGGFLILGAVDPQLGAAASQADSAVQAQTVQIPYLVLSGLFFLLALVFARIRLPRLSIEAGERRVSSADGGSAWAFPHLTFGALAIFLYVGAEVAIGSFLINFLGEPHIAGLGEAAASRYVAYYWGGAMVGRFAGAFIMRYLPAHRVLGYNALIAAALVLLAIFSSGAVAMWALILVGLFNSIMFPTIFSLAVTGLRQHTSQGSGILCLAIVGGAIVPLLQGMMADAVGLQAAFILSVLCYLYITFYGWVGSTLSPEGTVQEVQGGLEP